MNLNREYKAVIFDLFGTLVDSFTIAKYEESLKSIAQILGISYDGFKQIWYETAYDRNTGVYPTTRDVMDFICKSLEVPVSKEQLDNARKKRYEYVREEMTPRTDAVCVLKELRNRGYKTGLISNCSPVTEELWNETPFPPCFDVSIFSTSAKIKKPDPQIYRLALGELGVEGKDCMYVGDGDSNELTGAREMGIHPVMISVEYEKDNSLYLYNRQEWGGPVISSLSEVLSLVDK
jgi:putative hydrolase of the HAD superfamily